jgi:hypothetical protein
MVRQLLADDSHGPLNELRAESMRSRSRHDSNLSHFGVSCKPGAIQDVTHVFYMPRVDA